MKCATIVGSLLIITAGIYAQSPDPVIVSVYTTMERSGEVNFL